MRRTLIALLLLAGLSVLHAQNDRPDKRQLRDLVLLDDGTYLRGIVTDIEADTIRIELALGRSLAIPRHRIRKLMMHGRRMKLGEPSDADDTPLPPPPRELPAQPLPMPRGRAFTTAISLLPGTDGNGYFSMGGAVDVGWRRQPKRGPGYGLVLGLARFDYSAPSFLALQGEMAWAVPRTRWRVGAAAGMSLPVSASSRIDLVDRRFSPVGRAWLGRLIYTEAQRHPMVLQAGIRWQRAFYGVRTSVDFQLVDATFARYELRLVMLAFSKKRRGRR